MLLQRLGDAVMTRGVDTVVRCRRPTLLFVNLIDHHLILLPAAGEGLPHTHTTFGGGAPVPT